MVSYGEESGSRSRRSAYCVVCKHNGRCGINHVGVYAGQQTINGVPTDCIDQHSGGVKLHDDWMLNSTEYAHAPAQVEFVHLRYPGE